jgi:cell division protein FtsB
MSYASDALIDAQKRDIERLEAENTALESENASLKGAVKGLGDLCDKYKAENAELVKRNEELQADVIRMFLNEVDRWIDCKQREMEEGQ